MTEHATGGPKGPLPAEEAVLLMAGALDLVLEQAEVAVRRTRQLLGRSDLLSLAADARDDLVSRGRNSGLRPPPFAAPEAHLEELAQRARRRAERARQAGPPSGDAGAADADAAGPGAG
ncbi:hypothetical protein ACFWXK_02820 [Streptomyces sp. NPDC059070]|uniref:hypothetical protein n=1 Tax=unclassified Streptomyces TaxID=2593676 RepID=UPI0034E1D765